MKLISSLIVLAAFMLGPQAVSAATVFTPPVIAWSSGTSTVLYKLHACKASTSLSGTTVTINGWDTAACGQTAADAFCNSIKGGTATSFTLGYTGYEKTLAIGISDSYKLACDPSSTDKTSPQAATSTAPSYISGGYNGCLGFTTITCAHDPYSKAANGDVGTGSIRRLRSTNDNRPAPRVLVEEQEED